MHNINKRKKIIIESANPQGAPTEVRHDLDTREFRASVLITSSAELVNFHIDDNLCLYLYLNMHQYSSCMCFSQELIKYFLIFALA